MRALHRPALRLAATSLLLAVSALAAGCTSPAKDLALEQADAAVERARSSPRVRALAAAELERAEVALQDARKAAEAGASPDRVEHLVYIVSQRAALAEARAAQQVARSEVAMLEGALDGVVLQGRLEQGRQRPASFPPHDRQSRAPWLAERPGHTPRQAAAALQEPQQAQLPLPPPQQGKAIPQEPLLDRAPPPGPLEIGSLEDLQEANAASPDAVAREAEALSREITLNLAQLSFAGAEPTSETGERLAAVAEQLTHEPERSVSIEAEFNLPDPEARTMLEQRVEIVRAILLRQGIAPERVVVRASGDGPAQPRAAPSFVEAPY